MRGLRAAWMSLAGYPLSGFLLSGFLLSSCHSGADVLGLRDAAIDGFTALKQNRSLFLQALLNHNDFVTLR